MILSNPQSSNLSFHSSSSALEATYQRWQHCRMEDAWILQPTFVRVT
ncbi:unnamed protein product [Nyctereutes procyonoides]|uniref:(raccoon dog) hypothetical protein n=1 Tax=Nyctereutes procyonoides TaxID=34880 RepID=A0A811ZE33_NYCPR|nr:unnamed protein product [Nyctereutes procyonoides]